MKVLLGVGNELRADEGCGSLLARWFKADGWVSIDGGTAPENFIGKIKKMNPDLVVIVDSADMGLEPGEVRIIPKEKIANYTITTHSMPLSMLMENFKRCILIGIQPKKIEFSEMSPEVKMAVERLMEILKSDKLNEISQL